MNFVDYKMALLGILAVVATIFIQGMIAAIVKARQPGAIPGKEPEADHASFVFRSYRTYLNSLENFPVFLGAAIVCILAGASPYWSYIWIWLYAIARIIHMVLYYTIATNKNPSPRSYFYILGVFATIRLIILGVVALI